MSPRFCVTVCMKLFCWQQQRRKEHKRGDFGNGLAVKTKTKTTKAQTQEDLTVCKELARIIVATKTKISLGKSHYQLLVVTLKLRFMFTLLVSSTVFVVCSFYNAELFGFIFSSRSFV